MGGHHAAMQAQQTTPVPAPAIVNPAKANGGYLGGGGATQTGGFDPLAQSNQTSNRQTFLGY